MSKVLKVIVTALLTLSSLGLMPITAETEYVEDYKYLHREWGEWVETDLVAWEDLEPAYDEVDAYEKQTDSGMKQFYKGKNAISEYWSSEKEGAELSRETLRRPIPISEEDAAKEGQSVWFYTDDDGYFVRKEHISIQPEPEPSEATFMKGKSFRDAVRELYSSGYNSFLRSTSAPAEGTETIDVSDKQDGSIMAFVDNDRNLRWYSEAENVYLNADASNMFEGIPYGSVIDGVIDLSGIDSSRTVSMYEMFTRQSGESINFGNIDTSSVTDMALMFRQSSYRSLDLSSFNTANVTSMSNMFDEMHSLAELNISSFDTTNVENMYEMFSATALTSLDLRHFNTANVTDMAGMFANCEALTAVNVTSFDTSKVTDMSGMFVGCASLESVDVSSFSFTRGVSTASMFAYMPRLKTLDLKAWYTQPIGDASNMFAGDSALTTIEVDGNKYSSFGGRNMFEGCVSLKGISGTVYDPQHVDGDYSKIDSGTCSPGYMTGTPIPACPVGPIRDVEITIKTFLDEEPYTGTEFEYFVVRNDTKEVLGFTNRVENGIAKCWIQVYSYQPTEILIYQVKGDNPWIQYDEAQFVKTITVPQVEPYERD